MVLERFDEHLSFFKFKYDFNEFCYSKFQDFENLYTILTINKGSSVFRTSCSSRGGGGGGGGERMRSLVALRFIQITNSSDHRRV